MKYLFLFLLLCSAVFAQSFLDCSDPGRSCQDYTDCSINCNQPDCASTCLRPKISFSGFGGVVVKGETGVFWGNVLASGVASKVTIRLTGTPPTGVTPTLSKTDSTDVELKHWGYNPADPNSDTGYTSTERSFDSYLNVVTTSSAVPGRYFVGITGMSDAGTYNRRPYNAVSIDVVSASTAISPASNAADAGSSLAYTVSYSGQGYDGAITPTCQVSGGLSVALNPSILSPSGGTITATVTIPTGTPRQSDYRLVCNGTGTGVYLLNSYAVIHVN